MKYCRFCGKQIRENANFCKHCGKKLSNDIQNETITIPGKCSNCGKTIGVFSKRTCCDNCLPLVLSKLESLQKQNNKNAELLSKKNKPLIYYLEILEKQIELHEEILTTKLYFPEIVTYCISKEEYYKEILDIVITQIKNKISIIQDKNSIQIDKRNEIKELEKLYGELSECKFNFEYLKDIIEAAQVFVKKYIFSLKTGNKNIILVDEETGEVIS